MKKLQNANLDPYWALKKIQKKERISIPAIMHRRNLLGFERKIQQMKKLQNANLDPCWALKKIQKKERISIPAIMHRRNLLGFERKIQQMKKLQNANLDPYGAFTKKTKKVSVCDRKWHFQNTTTAQYTTAAQLKLRL